MTLVWRCLAGGIRISCPSVESQVSATVKVNAMTIYMDVRQLSIIDVTDFLLRFLRYQVLRSKGDNHMPRLCCIRMSRIQDSNNMVRW
jgi:hypothetical protein